jgi:sigma-E factor negative regulatory protein RseB
MPVAKWLAALALAVGAAGTSSAAHPDPLDLLDKMNGAIRALDYEGRFVVQNGDRLDALYIVHRVTENGELERVVSLTGEPREIIRGDAAVACLVPGDNGPINMARPAQGQSYSPLASIDGRELEQFYEIRFVGNGRVAGRTAYEVHIAPRDDLRFGYRLLVDQATALPLRSIMVDSAAKTLSQMMFTDLTIGKGVTPIERDVSALEKATADPRDMAPLDRLAPAAWSFADEPPGFKLNVHRRRALPDRSAEMEHFIFSDGLATVSVYVQPAQDGDALSGVSRMAAANAIGRTIGGYEVIVVGEAPVKTLDWFARSIQAVE